MSSVRLLCYLLYRLYVFYRLWIISNIKKYESSMRFHLTFLMILLYNHSSSHNLYPKKKLMFLSLKPACNQKNLKPLNPTNCVRPLKYKVNRSTKSLWNPILYIFCDMRPWTNLSKALEKSVYMTSSYFLSLIAR